MDSVTREAVMDEERTAGRRLVASEREELLAWWREMRAEERRTGLRATETEAYRLLLERLDG
jgi:hypothetical protein